MWQVRTFYKGLSRQHEEATSALSNLKWGPPESGLSVEMQVTNPMGPRPLFPTLVVQTTITIQELWVSLNIRGRKVNLFLDTEAGLSVLLSPSSLMTVSGVSERLLT